ncbi:MAG: arylsulfatase [Opitutaceae bacterium]|nr:arylsulfatase [Opitutaceae bacterium]
MFPSPRPVFRLLRVASRSLLLALPLALHAATRSQPNVIFILSDDLGYSDISPYGQKQIQTPQLQRLADEGMLFTNAYSGSAVCGPSRAALFLGLHNGHNPIRHNPGAARGWDRTTQGDPPLPENVPTFGKVMKQAGYATACFGKWGMGVPGQAGSPRRLGFDTFLGYASHVDAHTYWPDHLWRNDEKVPMDGKTYSHDLFTKEALAYVRGHRDQPFLLYLSYAIPHVALDPPSLAPYENQPWPEKEKAFAAMVTRMDTDIGKLVSLLTELKIDNNTLVIFASDNGPCTAGGHKASTFKSTPFRAEKGQLYEGGIRIPFIARWPGRVAAGSRSDLPICFYDILATFADVAGQPPPARTDGISFLPTLLGRLSAQKQHEYLYWEYGAGNGFQAVRMSDWKAVFLNVSQPGEPKLELYNLKTDPQEQHDVASQQAAIAEKMKRIARESHTPNRMFPLTHAEFQTAPPNIVTPNKNQLKRAHKAGKAAK